MWSNVKEASSLYPSLLHKFGTRVFVSHVMKYQGLALEVSSYFIGFMI